MKHIWKAIPLFLLVGTLAFSGCEQKDSAVGSDLAPGLNEIYPQQLVLDPTASAYYQALATTGASSYLYLGHDQGYEADALLKFNPYTVLPDSYSVDSLKVVVYLDSLITTQSSVLNVSVYFVNYGQEWNEIGITWDNLDSLQLGDPFASFEIAEDAPDSFSVSFALPAPDSLLRAWEMAGSDSKTLHFNNGLYLWSDKSADFLLRLCSAEHSTVSQRPQLEMYIRDYDNADSSGTPADTMLSLYAGADAFIAKDFGTLDASYLYLGNSAAYRSLLLYDVEGLLPAYGVAVQRAEIVLHADTTSEYNLDKIISAFTQEMEDSTWLQDPASAPVYPSSALIGGYDADQATLTLNLTDMAYGWIRNPGSNHGVIIKSASEYLNISRTVFYGLSAPDSLRPKLRIVYLEGGQ